MNVDEKYRRWKCFHQHEFQSEVISRLLRNERMQWDDGFHFEIPADSAVVLPCFTL